MRVVIVGGHLMFGIGDRGHLAKTIVLEVRYLARSIGDLGRGMLAIKHRGHG